MKQSLLGNIHTYFESICECENPSPPIYPVRLSVYQLSPLVSNIEISPFFLLIKKFQNLFLIFSSKQGERVNRFLPDSFSTTQSFNIHRIVLLRDQNVKLVVYVCFFIVGNGSKAKNDTRKLGQSTQNAKE